MACDRFCTSLEDGRVKDRGLWGRRMVVVKCRGAHGSELFEEACGLRGTDGGAGSEGRRTRIACPRSQRNHPVDSAKLLRRSRRWSLGPLLPLP